MPSQLIIDHKFYFNSCNFFSFTDTITWQWFLYASLGWESPTGVLPTPHPKHRIIRRNPQRGINDGKERRSIWSIQTPMLGENARTISATRPSHMISGLNIPPTLHFKIEQGLTSHWTHYKSYQGRIFRGQITQPTVSKHGSTGPQDQVSIPPGPPHHVTIIQHHNIWQ